MRNPFLAASHLFVLVRAMEQSEGPVLEMGTGYYSTPVLHWLCGLMNRKLVSYDTEAKWAKLAKDNYENDFHTVIHLEDLDKADIENTKWGLVLIDHSPHARRPVDAHRVKNNATFVVMHDTEPNAERLYHYSPVYGKYKYVYQDCNHYPWTAVLSNEKKFLP